MNEQHKMMMIATRMLYEQLRKEMVELVTNVQLPPTPVHVNAPIVNNEMDTTPIANSMGNVAEVIVNAQEKQLNAISTSFNAQMEMIAERFDKMLDRIDKITARPIEVQNQHIEIPPIELPEMEPPVVNVKMPKRKTSVIKRDANGDISEVIDTYEY